MIYKLESSIDIWHNQGKNPWHEKVKVQQVRHSQSEISFEWSRTTLSVCWLGIPHFNFSFRVFNRELRNNIREFFFFMIFISFMFYFNSIFLYFYIFYFYPLNQTHSPRVFLPFLSVFYYSFCCMLPFFSNW